MTEYIPAGHAAYRLHNMGSPTDESMTNLSNMVIHNQVLAALIKADSESIDDVLVTISRDEALSDTGPHETMAYDDYRLVITNATNSIQADPNLYLHKGNPEEDTTELALMYPRMGSFVVPVQVMYHNMESLGGTIKDGDFVSWVNYRLHNTYPKRNYGVIHFRDTIPWKTLRWRRDINVYVLCASSYLPLHDLEWSWHRVPRSVYTLDDEAMTVNVQFNTVTHEHKAGVIMRSYINDTQHGFDGVPILLYFVTSPEEQLMIKDEQPFMATIRGLHLHNEEVTQSCTTYRYIRTCCTYSHDCSYPYYIYGCQYRVSG